jgi:hypothetical protein
MNVDTILGLSKEHWEIIFKVLGPILGAAVAYHQRRFFIRPRAKLKTDLELLDLMNVEEVKAEREKIRQSIANQVEQIYGETTSIKTKRNYWLLGFGFIWALAFSSFTFFISKSDDWSNWWCLLTVFLAMAGLGWMIAGWEGKTSVGSEESDLTTIEVPTELIPQVNQLIAKNEKQESA